MPPPEPIRPAPIRPEPIRLDLADSLSQRYARSSLAVYGVLGLCFVLFLLVMHGTRPSFAMFTAASALFAGALLVYIRRDPLGILTMRVQKKLAARQFVFDPHGLTVIRLDGEARRFARPQAEIFPLPGPGGQDYYLQIGGEAGQNASFYLGNDPREIDSLADLLERSGALLRYEKAPEPGLDPKPPADRFFS